MASVAKTSEIKEDTKNVRKIYSVRELFGIALALITFSVHWAMGQEGVESNKSDTLATNRL